jgi:hypothetical protein
MYDILAFLSEASTFVFYMFIFIVSSSKRLRRKILRAMILDALSSFLTDGQEAEREIKELKNLIDLAVKMRHTKVTEIDD